MRCIILIFSIIVSAFTLNFSSCKNAIYCCSRRSILIVYKICQLFSHKCFSCHSIENLHRSSKMRIIRSDLQKIATTTRSSQSSFPHKIVASRCSITSLIDSFKIDSRIFLVRFMFKKFNSDPGDLILFSIHHPR